MARWAHTGTLATGHTLSSLHVHTHRGALACAGLHSPCPTSPPTAHRFKYQSSLSILEVLPIFLQTNIHTPKRRTSLTMSSDSAGPLNVFNGFTNECVKGIDSDSM